MAKITKMPGMEVVDGFKGVIDYYVHCGQACVRSWPTSPGHGRAPAVEAQWPAWTVASRLWALLSQDVRDAFNQMAAGTNLSGRDIQVKSYISRAHIRIP